MANTADITGVNFDLSRDACSGKGYPQHNTSWIKFRAAIDECSQKRGFPMVLSVESCDDPSGCGLWIGQLANLWRTCGDIQATFASVMRNVAENTKMAKWAGPSGGPLNGGHWNDAGDSHGAHSDSALSCADTDSVHSPMQTCCRWVT
jgi:hypothetical protein